MKKVLNKFIVLVLAFVFVFVTMGDVFALSIVFKGNADNSAGKSVTIALYKPDADINNISALDISYINQEKIADDGSFEISLPVSLLTATESKLVSNMSGKIFSDQIPLYASSLGTDEGDGTKENPYTFQKSLQEVVDNGKIIVDGLVSLGTDFVWPESDKTITISGENNAVIDIKTLDHLQINCNTTFENLTFGCSQTGSGEDVMPENSISANGYHVIIKESVETENILSIRGGSTTKAVDSTNLEVYGGHYKTIYGGGSAHNVNGDCILTIGGNVNKNYGVSDTASNYVPTAIHGGCWGGVVKGDCITTLKGNAKSAYVYGGTHGQNTSYVEGENILNIEGGTFMNVFANAFVTEGKSVLSTINIKGGTVEGVFATDSCTLSGNITMNFIGGTVTRRIYGGSYNNYPSSTDYYVNGNITMVFYDTFDFNITNSWNSGIFGGTRKPTSHAEENCKLIFLNDSYDKFKDLIGEQGSYTVNDSYHDYIISATKGGLVASSGASKIKITPDDGYSVKVNGSEFTQSEYALEESITNVEFVSLNKGIYNVDYTAGDKKSTVSVDYDVDAESLPVLIVAVYDNSKKLVTVNHQNLTDISGVKDIEVECNLLSGEKYYVETMIWNNTQKLMPICSSMTITIPAS